jgi:hypothetical protein
MIPFTSCGESFLSGIRLFDQNRQRSNHDAGGIVATDGNRELIWYSKGATKILRNISCSSVPLDAVICQFAVATGAESLHNSAIAILLTCDLLQLHLVNGEIFDIHLPFPMIKICSSSTGLILQRKHTHSVFERNRSGTSTKSQFCRAGVVANGESNFDLKLWLDESNEETDLPLEVRY